MVDVTERWLLLYDVAEDYVARRVSLRAAHLRLAEEAQGRGELLAAGAFEDNGTFEGAILVFTDRAAAEAFATADPYVANGLVTRFRVRKWNVVVGSV